MAKQPKKLKQVETLTHDEAKRRNIPTAELQSAAQRAEEAQPFEPVTYQRKDPLPEGATRPRDEDLDPQITWKGATLKLTKEQVEQLNQTGKLEIGDAQLVWRGKDQQDWSDLVVQAPPLYIQEKIHPKAIIDDLKRQTKERQEQQADMPDLFGDFNGIDPEAKTEFYQHDQHWSNRMILGDSLQVMASLAEREGLRGQVQCIYFDPPYGIKFNSNWQVSTQSRDVKDGKQDHIAREPEVVKAFRDTWKDGIHSYLTYLRDRMTVMRDLLTDSGSIFVQIGDENVHRVRAVMDDIFGEDNFINQINCKTNSGTTRGKSLKRSSDYLLWYSKTPGAQKFRRVVIERELNPSMYSHLKLADQSIRSMSLEEKMNPELIPKDALPFAKLPMHSMSSGENSPRKLVGREWKIPSNRSWRHSIDGFLRLYKADRINPDKNSLRSRYYHNDYSLSEVTESWVDTSAEQNKTYVVQTSEKIIQRCILMATDPGDLVLDPTCGSGTTASVSEQLGRRWITIDTSRVSLALARTRLMSARYPYYYLADSLDGRQQEQKISGKIQPGTPTHGDIRQGFVYGRAPHITLKNIANNAEIDVIWDNYQQKLEPLRESLNKALSKKWEEWEIPRDAGEGWAKEVKDSHAKWWDLRIKRQQEIDKSIAQKADVELLYDRPYEDNSKVRVAGPFTVESLSPHRVVPADEEQLTDRPKDKYKSAESYHDFTKMVMENLKSAGVHQATKDDRITLTSVEGWPGTFIAAEGRFMEGETERRAAIFIGPEFGSVTRADLTAAAREANDVRFDVLIACGFNFDAHTGEITKMGPLPILKAKMNPDLHMSEELKNTGAGNLFVVFGEPDIEWDFDDDGNITVEVLGIDVFDPKSGEVRASGKDDIAAWFIDTDYNEESFFVRHAYFMGANDPYKSLKTSLKAEIDKEAWETLYRDTSRPFARPTNGRFAVKVINHFGDEVMKVFGV
ncbi:MAG: site-specific DNA-methyltransferase [Methyloligella sp.]|nr:MAG: site-specific DNA-methyltransferase [Methyloligella sp.]